MFEQRLEQGERLIDDAREHVPEIAQGPSLDAVLIAAMQKTEHYCIAAWGTAKSLAQAVEQDTVVKSMERALREGKTVDEQLTQLAETEITPLLLAGDSEEQTEGNGSNQSRNKKSGSERRASN